MYGTVGRRSNHDCTTFTDWNKGKYLRVDGILGMVEERGFESTTLASTSEPPANQRAPAQSAGFVL